MEEQNKKEVELLEKALDKFKEVDFLDLFYSEQLEYFNKIDKEDRFDLKMFNMSFTSIFKHALVIYNDLASYKEELEEKKTKTEEHKTILNKLNKYFLMLELEKYLKNKQDNSNNIKKINKI